MEPLPFASTIWEIGTGENASGNLVSIRHVEILGRRIGRRVPFREGAVQ